MGQQKTFAERQKEFAERQKALAERKRELDERKKKLAEYQMELGELEQAYQRGNFQLFVVSGPEGSGKAMLIQEFCGWKRRITLKATGKDTTTLQNFAESVQRHYEKPRTESLTAWDGIFRFIADNEQGKGRMGQRLVLVLHEFPDPVRRDDQFMKMFKNAIDLYLSKTKIFLVITSSDAEFVRKYFLDENAMLHQNLNGCIRLDKFTIGDDEAERIADEAAKAAKGISNARMKIQKFSADEVILREG